MASPHVHQRFIEQIYRLKPPTAEFLSGPLDGVFFPAIVSGAFTVDHDFFLIFPQNEDMPRRIVGIRYFQGSVVEDDVLVAMMDSAANTFAATEFIEGMSIPYPVYHVGPKTTGELGSYCPLCGAHRHDMWAGYASEEFRDGFKHELQRLNVAVFGSQHPNSK